MQTSTLKRQMAVADSMRKIRHIINYQGVTSASLEQVKDTLLVLAAQAELFGPADYPTPTTEEYGKVYLLRDDDDGRFALYLVSSHPVGPSPIHDHGTWAVIAGLAGEEENTVYKRLDDGQQPGQANLKIDYKITLGQGDAIALMPDDIHHIVTTSEEPTRHFHLYGKGFIQQTDRLEFNLEEGTTKSVSGAFVPVDTSRRVE
jgi:predicted metal-dependent enzyme (double-stranded beta helix superfamily)